MYSRHIIHRPSISNYSPNNQRDLLLDTAENLTQIGHWATASFDKNQTQIELFLLLTRKNIKALQTFPLAPEVSHKLEEFCVRFDALELEYRTGIPDMTVWAHEMLAWGTTLSQNAHLI